MMSAGLTARVTRNSPDAGPAVGRRFAPIAWPSTDSNSSRETNADGRRMSSWSVPASLVMPRITSLDERIQIDDFVLTHSGTGAASLA